MQMVKFTIEGEAASKANSRKFAKFGKRIASIKSDKAREFERSAHLQIPDRCRVMWKGKVGVLLKMFYASERPDMDESIVLDVLQARYERIKGPDGKAIKVLQSSGVYINDRQVRERHVFHDIDKARPRVEVVVWQL